MIKARSTVKSLKGLRDLCNYIGNTQNMSLIEIGSFAGESTEIFAQNFKVIYAIDLWSEKKADDCLKPFMEEAELKFNKIAATYGNIIKIKGESIEISKNFLFKANVIYIDGSHDYKSVLEDIIAWKSHIINYISGHDYRLNKFPGVIKAVNKLLGKPDKIFCDYSWIKKI